MFRKYMTDLKKHPGVTPASVFTVCGFFAGLSREGDWVMALAGAAMMSIFWIPILLTVGKTK